MDLKSRFSVLFREIMEKSEMTQKDLANFLGISQSRVSSYLHGKESPSAEIIHKIGSLFNLDYNTIFNSNNDIEIPKETIQNAIYNYGSDNIVVNTVQGDVYHNTKVTKQIMMQPDERHITEEQASNITKKVNEIVELEKSVSKKPKSHAAVWNSIKAKFKVAQYRMIPKEKYNDVADYLDIRIGLLKKKMKPGYEKRKERYSAIFARLRNIGWSKEDLTNYIYSKYEVESVKELSNDELESLYNYIMKKK